MTINDVIARITSVLPASSFKGLPVPAYSGSNGRENLPRVGLAVGSMRRHTTDEGWQLFAGLEHAGYRLTGHALPISLTNVPAILDAFNPGTLMIQDKREWIGKTAGPGFDTRERFSSVDVLRDRPDVFKLTVIKDAQNDLDMHVEAAQEIGCHGWVTYYHPRIVKRLAPFVREQHLVRTWHSVDQKLVPPFDAGGRRGCLLSGAISGAYPWRKHLAQYLEVLPNVVRLAHPGYGRNICRTPDFLRTLSTYKVAIVTCSLYGYALRKLIEATACGCRVITNLPEDDRVPEIEENLVRVDENIGLERLRILIDHHVERYDSSFQQEMASRACRRFDFRETGKRLAAEIEKLRRNYDRV